mmetsp:Transcript_8064/g.23104  ORF Transcript_8064/g.23104 Transcript_8064/m.23104 type:complete len:395 (-) Transcript_8064:110-1294(-)
MATGTSVREKRKKPALAPITVPTEAKPKYHITDSGTFSEGNFTINREGLVIGNTDSPVTSRPNSSRGSGCSTVASNGREVVSAPREGSAGEPSTSGATNVVDTGFDVSLDDLEEKGVVGSGSSGVVRKVKHKATGELLVLKVIQFDVQSDQLRKQITQELRMLHSTNNPYVVRYYQSFFENGSITAVMEYMDGGTLAHICNHHREGIEERYLADIARQVLSGLAYLHREMRIVHRDIKPSNLLINRQGDVKISDFGVSGQLANSVSKCVSWVGTVTYMSPERIRGESYSWDSDIWSLGLSLVEAAMGRFPYPPPGSPSNTQPLGFWDLLDYIVEEPPPRLNPETSSPELCNFLACCLQKNPKQRVAATKLLEHPFIKKYENSGVNVADLITSQT